MSLEYLLNLVSRPQLPLQVILTALVIACCLGAIHALTFGQAKVPAAACLVGAQGTLPHALLIGGSLTLTHTISVFLLGMGILIFARFTDVERISDVLGVLSGLLIAGVGARLLYRRWRRLTQQPHHAQEHVSAASLIALGASGGLVPDPTALVLLSSTISLGHPKLALLLIMSFSFGMALVLIALGAAMIYAKRWIPDGRPHAPHGWKWLPVLSAGCVVGIGCLITGLSIARMIGDASGGQWD